MRWSMLVADGGFSWRSGCCFDPGTLMAASMAMTAISGAATAAGTLAAGSSAADAAGARKMALQNEASSAFASNQRQALDTEQRTRMAISTSRARAAASGVNAGLGSPAENEGEIAQRGSYQALMDIFNGKSRADALRYEGDLAEYEGKTKKTASLLSAVGTLAGTAGSMFKTYGAFKYPTTRGPASVNF